MALTRTSNRGGRRAGAGRKRFRFRLDPETAATLMACAKAQGREPNELLARLVWAHYNDGRPHCTCETRQPDSGPCDHCRRRETDEAYEAAFSGGK